jgi:hypothetical protein
MSDETQSVKYSLRWREEEDIILFFTKGNWWSWHALIYI